MRPVRPVRRGAAPVAGGGRALTRSAASAPPERLLGILLVLVVAAVVIAAIGLSQRSDEPVVAGGPTGSVATVRVTRVVDGDTVVAVVDGREERIRFIGIDAPELAREADGLPAECGADDARLAVEALLGGEEIRLERDVSDRDRFGRLLRHPWLGPAPGWELATERLVRAGHVEARSFPPDVRHDARLSAAEGIARAARAGVWGPCP